MSISTDPWFPWTSISFNNTNGRTITGVTTHNIYGKDPLLGPLADNGGPTPTHALLPGSPAIDHGSSGGLATDQRGLPRIFNFPAYFDAADGSDIGTYELQERAQTGPVFTVNTTDDVDDGVPGIAHCSLREAIAAANANSTTNAGIIIFATNVPGLYTGVTGTITLTNGALVVGKSMTILGQGPANLAVDGNGVNRVFLINPGNNVTIASLTITNGFTDTLTRDGAGICNDHSALTLSNCTLSGNSSYAAGGGIYNCAYQGGTATLVVFATTFSGNLTRAQYGGGGIFNQGYGGGNAVLTVNACTFSGNSGAVHGGGIYNWYGTVEVASSTFSGNLASSTGCDLINDGGTLQIRNTILNAGASVGTIAGVITSLGYNLSSDGGGGFLTATGDRINTDPKLGPLADLGGPTPTHALRFDSPALDAGHSGGLTTDQRGLPRPIDSPDIANAEGGDGSDIGAYEGDPNLRITGYGKTGGDIWLSFNSILGRTYRVESTDQLPPIWNELTNGVIGTGGRFQALDGGAASLPQRFYRTVLLP